MRLSAPGVGELGSEGGKDQDRELLEVFDRQVEQFARARIDPMQVLENHDDRPLPGEAREVPQEGLESPLLFRQRRQIERRIKRALQEKQLGEQRDIVPRRRGRCEKRLELANLLLRRVLAVEACGPLQLADDREEHAALVMRQTEETQERVRLGAKPVLQSDREARLADAGLA